MLEKNNPDEAVENFDKLFEEIVNKHAPVKKRSIRSVRSPWNELKECMEQRDNAKKMAIRSMNRIAKFIINYATKLNIKKKKTHHEKVFNNIKHDSKKLWNTLNNIMGRKSRSIPSFLESEGLIITRPSDVAEHINNYFVNKVKKLRDKMSLADNAQSFFNIRN